MNLFNHGKLSGFRGAIRERLKDRELRHIQLTSVRAAVEQVVEGTDGRIRLVSGYQKKLHEVVHGALEYTDGLVDRIPEAIEINRNSFASHDHVNAFFVDFADLQRVFSRCPELREFLRDQCTEASSRCCALLCMHKSEKTVVGMALSGDMLKKEVLQVAVSFTDHMLYSPAPSEVETREGLKECLFNGLVTLALERIVKSRADNHRLRDMRQMLNARLLHLQHKQESEDQFATGLSREIANTRVELDDVDKALLDSRPVTPLQSLENVKDVFSRPEQFVRLGSYTLRLSKMGIRIDQNSTEPCNRLDLTEVVVGNEPPRVISLVKFAGEALLN